MSKASDNEAFVRRVQTHLGITVDGWAGEKTNSAFDDYLPHGAVDAGGNSVAGSAADEGGSVTPAESGGASDSTSVVDERSAKNIATLEPKVRPYFEAIQINGTRIARDLGADAYTMISGTRTYAEQDALYAQGRTTGGPRVTNARGGYSNHNFGIAGDFGVFQGGRYLDSANPALASKIHKAVAAWVKANLPVIEWGGDWTSFRDEPHFQYRTGLSLAEMRARVAAGRSVIS